MNKDYVLWNLCEAKEELDRTIKEIEADETYEYGDFIVAMQHLYHHINTAWNARTATKEEADECSEENFAKWRDFPTDIDMNV